MIHLIQLEIYGEMYYNINYPDGEKEKLVYPSLDRYFIGMKLSIY